MLLLLLAFACGHHEIASSAPGALAPASPGGVSAAPRSSEVLAPRPFDAAGLATGIPQGTKIRLRIESAGEPTVEQRWEFSRCTPTEATVHSVVYDDKGALLNDEGEATSAWSDLEQHANFPAAATTRTDGHTDGPLGPLDIWLYTVTVPGDDGILLVKHYQFAKTLPGPPVLFTIERQGDEIFRMTMLERTPR